MSTVRSRRLMEKTKTSCSSPSWSITSLTLNPCPKKLLPSARGWGFTRLIFFLLSFQPNAAFLSVILPPSSSFSKKKWKWNYWLCSSGGAQHTAVVWAAAFTPQNEFNMRSGQKEQKSLYFDFFFYIYINMGSQDRNQIWISMNHPTLPLNWINHTACCCSPAANGL